MDLEQTLREFYTDICCSIERDQQLADEFREKTKLTTGHHKRWHVKLNKRMQRLWYQHDTLKMLAHRAGIELKKGGESKQNPAESEANAS